ncbi:hypothetical protein V7149_05885 [Bacillus sp. JJ1503]|uniref:hypothetical protein n=1 Tax=unclassified Bacillus (in: firmicutes) TaxID=185979 RepID=UPI002FFFD477
MNNRFITEILTMGMSNYLLGSVVDQESPPARRMMKRMLSRRKKNQFYLRDLPM